MSALISTAQTPPRSLDRRRFLRLLAVAGAGAITVQKWELFKQAFAEGQEITQLLASAATIDASPLDPKALRGAYSMFLAAQGLSHVPVSVVLAPHFNRHGTVANSLPPEHLWKNILPTLKVVDRLARELGERVHINSAYRSPAYNATCPGAARWSQHLRNNALDVQFRSASSEVARAARKLREEGVFRGGIGLYPNFTHIDTRGHNSDW